MNGKHTLEIQVRYLRECFTFYLPGLVYLIDYKDNGSRVPLSLFAQTEMIISEKDKVSPCPEDGQDG